jgi:predicted HTH transcriptional regulator
MINCPINEINKTNIGTLITDKIEESRTLEYKEELLIGTDNEKKEFLADVSSFANALGGDIIYGIKEERNGEGKKTGRAEETIGIENMTNDEATLRIENIIRDGLSPRLKVQIKCIEGFRKGSVIVLRIPQSFSAPHMILKGSSKFYSRNSAGKYPLDVGEIRSSFLTSEALPEKIKRFREQRLAEIIADQTPVQLNSSQRFVIHLIPISSFLYGSNNQKIIVASKKDMFSLQQTIEETYSDYRYNIDGYLFYPRSGNGHYYQVYRTGIVEYVDCNLIVPVELEDKIKHYYINHKDFESEIIWKVSKYIDLMKQFNIEIPILVMISLLDVKGVEMSYERKNIIRNFFTSPASIDRDSIIIPDILLDDYSVKIPNILKPAFDSIWQACGYECSPNYDEQSNWSRPR